jgi:hypothetical protein
MTRSFNKSKGNKERGIALFIAIFTVLLITAIGAGMIILTNTDTTITQNFRDEQTAFFAAKAGMEEARDRFRATATGSLTSPINLLPLTLPGNPGAFLYITNPANAADIDTPWLTTGNNYPDNEVCTEMANMNKPCIGNPPVPPGGGWYATTTASAAYQMAPKANWKWTRINLKTNKTASGSTNINTVDGNLGDDGQLVCWTGTNQITVAGITPAGCQAVNPNYLPVYVMTTLAVTPTGSRRMVQAEVSANAFPTIPGPMVFDGSNPNFNVPSSNAFSVNGLDMAQGPNNGAGCPAKFDTAALGGYDQNSANALTAVANNRPAGYTGAPGTGSPSVENINNQLGPLGTVGGLESLVSQLTLIAGNENNVYPSNPSTIGAGTAANPLVNVVQGDLTLPGGFTGYGIIVVEGTLTLQGNPNYNGLILVIGKGVVVKNGGGNGTVDGAMLVANLYDANGNLLPANSAPGVPSVTWNGGGTVQWNYDSCWSQAMSQGFAWRVLGVRELIR